MEKKSIYGLTLDQLTTWLVENGQRSSVQHKYGIGYIKESDKLFRYEESEWGLRTAA